MDSTRAVGSNRRVYKIHGKIFMIVTDAADGAMVTIKVDPIRAEILRQQYVEISSGHGMNRRHWISITASDAISREVFENEVRESYRLVRAKLPTAERTSDGRRKRSLSGKQLQAVARMLASGLPGVDHGRPFVEKLDVYKVGGKVFMIVTDDPNELIITVRAEPEQRGNLFERFASVTAGRYLDKDRWISVGAGKGITQTVVSDVVKASYRLVLDTVPRRERPAGITDV
ncbi:MmcQ/YjbR family DNA-binding protein [Methylopila turkensis]|uniref:MmcQ/YjbR family DNA-binding protein n=1 Tax=Methylopila turkensis TaxID=1437816 RepID=UPI0022F2AB42|nr:MmcQ/YjbR family DNA-binding protein [Methylopila turkensis]